MEIRPSFADRTTPNRVSTTLPADESSSISPARDGLVGLYALRILDRGIDPRTLVVEHRSIRYGLNERASWRQAADPDLPPVVTVGRSAVRPDTIDSPGRAMMAPVVVAGRSPAPARVRRLSLPSTAGLTYLLRGAATPALSPRRLVAAGLAAAVMLGVGLLGALAQEQPSSPAYTVEADAPASAGR